VSALVHFGHGYEEYLVINSFTVFIPSSHHLAISSMYVSLELLLQMR
jgi:hypothetical protein